MKLSVRRITMTALLIAVIFAQEEVLTLVPNVQLTVLLLFVYGAVCGPYYGSVIVFAHVLLDNLVMGSMIPTVVIPMFIGWEIAMLLGYASRKSKLWFVCVLSAVAALIYCYLFVATNALFLNVDIKAYLLSDIPFEIILAVCSVVTIMFLYEPLKRLLSRHWDNKKDVSK